MNENRQTAKSQSENDQLRQMRAFMSRLQHTMKCMNDAENMDESALEELEEMSSVLQAIQSQFPHLLSKEESDQ